MATHRFGDAATMADVIPSTSPVQATFGSVTRGPATSAGAAAGAATSGIGATTTGGRATCAEPGVGRPLRPVAPTSASTARADITVRKLGRGGRRASRVALTDGDTMAGSRDGSGELPGRATEVARAGNLKMGNTSDATLVEPGGVVQRAIRPVVDRVPRASWAVRATSRGPPAAPARPVVGGPGPGMRT